MLGTFKYIILACNLQANLSYKFKPSLNITIINENSQHNKGNLIKNGNYKCSFITYN